MLQWRAGDIKALYRAGVASLELGDAQTARQYLIQASRGKPNGKNQSHSTSFFFFFWSISWFSNLLQGLILGKLSDFARLIFNQIIVIML